MQYRVIIQPPALKELAALPMRMRQRISRAIDKLADAPRPTGCIKLTGAENDYRIRVGKYRVLYDVADKVLTVAVVRVKHRREAYGT